MPITAAARYDTSVQPIEVHVAGNVTAAHGSPSVGVYVTATGKWGGTNSSGSVRTIHNGAFGIVIRGPNRPSPGADKVDIAAGSDRLTVTVV